jgi:hypothetical protein
VVKIPLSPTIKLQDMLDIMQFEHGMGGGGGGEGGCDKMRLNVNVMSLRKRLAITLYFR